jgi:serine protease
MKCVHSAFFCGDLAVGGRYANRHPSQTPDLLLICGLRQLSAGVLLPWSPTNQIIIKYRATADISGANAPAHPDRISALSAVAGVPLEYFREMSGDAHVLRLPGKLPVSDVSLIADKLMALGDVEYAEPDRILQYMVTPNDPQYTSQWHYYEPGASCARRVGHHHRVEQCRVAVIDTGITNHADLSGRTLPGYDCIAEALVANDGDGRDSSPSDPGDWITPPKTLPVTFRGCRAGCSQHALT